MSAFVDFAQAGGADVRVDLRGDEALVPQQFLDTADVGAAVEQMRGEAMAERVGSGAGVERLPAGCAFPACGPRCAW